MKTSLLPPEKLKTGIPRLDTVLGGGFNRNGCYIVVGPAGSGKTILTNEICFSAIRESKAHALYITLTTESQSKIVQHLSQLSFYDPEEIGRHLFYVSGRQRLQEDGLGGFRDFIAENVKKFGAKILVVDGIERLYEPREKNKISVIDFFHDVQSYLSVTACTAFFIRTSIAKEETYPEVTAVDGILRLHMEEVGPRLVRELSVNKLRGSKPLPGRHEMELTDAGVVIHPRTEIQFLDVAAVDEGKRTRVSFGIPKLDEMLRGGVWSNSATCLLGAPGTGKTLLGCHFLVEGAKRGEKSVYFGFYEPPERLIQKCEMVGLDFRRYVEAGLIEIIWQPPLERNLDSLAEMLLEPLRKNPKAHRRLYIDGFEGFRASAVYEERLPRFLSALTNQLRVLNVTNLISVELNLFKREMHLPRPQFGSIMENVIALRFTEAGQCLTRVLTLMKTRDSDYDPTIHQMKISDKGIQLERLGPQFEDVLSGEAHV